MDELKKVDSFTKKVNDMTITLLSQGQGNSPLAKEAEPFVFEAICKLFAEGFEALAVLSGSKEYRDRLARVIEGAKRDYVKKNNQVIMIENMPSDMELGYSPSELLEIITKVNRSNLKFIFDTGHAHCSIYEDTSFLYQFVKIKPLIEAVLKFSAFFHYSFYDQIFVIFIFVIGF